MEHCLAQNKSLGSVGSWMPGANKVLGCPQQGKSLGEYSRKWPESQWKTIPYQRANHGKGPALHGGTMKHV